MAKFNEGDQIMVISYVGSSHWYGPYTVTRMVNKKKGYGRYDYDTWVPGNRYVEYEVAPPKKVECWSCDGLGLVPNEAAGIAETCSVCKGEKSLTQGPLLRQVVNRSDNVVSVWQYENAIKPVLEAMTARKQNEEKARQDRIQKHIHNIVEIARNSQNPDLEVAKYVSKYSYSYSAKGGGTTELYNAAYWVEKEAQKVATA